MKRFVVSLLLAASPVAAQSFLLAGHLDDGDAPASGSFAVSLALTDGADTLWTEEQTGVIVVDGVFAIDVGAAEPLPLSVPGRARLTVVIDGDALPPMPLSRLLRADRAVRADLADAADSADVVAGVDAAGAVTVSGLLLAGEAPVPFSALTGVPAGVADGDQGTDVTPAVGSGISLTSRTLAIQSVNGSRFATGALAGSSLASSSITGAEIANGAVTGAKIADGTMPPNRLTGRFTEREVKGRVVFRVTEETCVEPIGTLTTQSTCAPTDLSCFPFTVCQNAALGVLVE